MSFVSGETRDECISSAVQFIENRIERLPCCGHVVVAMLAVCKRSALHSPMPTDDKPTILLTGATGYIGGRVAPRLLDLGYRVRCVSRCRSKVGARPWADRDGVELFEGDVGDRAAMTEVMTGCSAAYYFVHSMNVAGSAYRERDLAMARSFGSAAADAGVSRLLYLGGLGETGSGLSKHLASRREVEDALGEGGVPVTVLRAAMIIGSGSASFEILRYLVERLPIMITPRWVHTESQPIAVRDVLHYLITALDTPGTIGRTIDIGGPDVLGYAEVMRQMAEALGLPRRIIIPVPVLTPRLSSLWIHLVTPLDASIARPLAEGLKNRVVCRNDDALGLMPHACLTVRAAMDAALAQDRADTVETAWSDAGVMPGDPVWAGGTVFVDRRTIEVEASREDTWAAVCSLGGRQGYFSADWLWRLRGMMDRLVGGPGLRRGRRSGKDLRLGDSLDFWRVTAIDPQARLELTAEMKLPGIATLTLEVEPAADEPAKPDEQGEQDERDELGEPGRSRIVMTARFRPTGLFGIAYWYAVLPLHGITFRGMLKGMAKAACARSE